MTDDGCGMCSLLERLDDDEIAFRDARWTIGMAVEVPGWLMMISNDHVEGVGGLDDVPAAEFGQLAARLSRAIEQVCDAERVYLMYQGEHAVHLHAMAMARGADVPPDWRGPALLGHRDDLADGEAARRVVAAVRDLLVDAGSS